MKKTYVTPQTENITIERIIGTDAIMESIPIAEDDG